MTSKKLIPLFLILAVGAGLIIYVSRGSASATPAASGPSMTVPVKFVSSTITADGSVTAQNQATLNFQTTGKLTYLPFKPGDKVQAGQTIAKLDTYTLQRQLTAALNNYRTARDTFDQAQANLQDNVLKSQITSTYVNTNLDFNSTVNDAIKRIADQNQAALDNSVINVELANYALQLSTLTSPITGVITRQDVTVPGLNITPATTFAVADLDSLVFRADIPLQDIYYVSPGSVVTLAIDGLPDHLSGTVSKIYPSKVILPTGEAVYQVDIVSDTLKNQAKLDQTGTAIISTNSENVAVVPAWTVLGGKSIWVDNAGTPQLKSVTIGPTFGNEIEIISGLSPDDRIIINPEYIIAHRYQIL